MLFYKINVIIYLLEFSARDPEKRLISQSSLAISNEQQQVSKILRVCFEVADSFEPYREEVPEGYRKQSCTCNCQCV